ncbi:hypothetical protein KOAAANKH_00992 [Brevundimonas sp. NIBR10]|uniref:hypothetical protein n=1 Tax=Brevundimonas sp. NIBR10 TaxID=3015997 RepID=UPI0022F17857|nr:hypothetical protein [Brevundimonas sp. NIBR10]WGM46126.1 hypothetical protein KOAAANKH_00992 [Brevundimonas sp. NIBR10]
MNEDVSELMALGRVRARLHAKANDYFFYDLQRWDRANWRLFFGATDALLDTEFALSNVARGIPADKQHAILACYGYLQALYIQQDAVALIWRALNLAGEPLADAKVRRVRELRNRIAGHPARAEKVGSGKRPSSSIINLHDIDRSSGFKAVIYYDDDMDVVDVSFSQLLADNCCGLTESLLEAERTMDEREAAFRQAEKAQPLSAAFENGLTYTLEKLRSGPGDSRREMAMRMLERSLNDLEAQLKDRKFWYEASEYPIVSIRAGLRLGERLHEIAEADRIEQTWWVISEGIDSHVQNLLRHLRAVDEKLAETPG